jgi:hypothetical protein
MTRIPTLPALLALAAFSLAAKSSHAAVYCLSQDPDTGKFRGAVVAREECIGDELEIGEPVDPEQGIIELFGQEINLPEALRYDWNATLVEVVLPTPDASPSPSPVATPEEE